MRKGFSVIILVSLVIGIWSIHAFAENLIHGSASQSTEADHGDLSTGGFVLSTSFGDYAAKGYFPSGSANAAGSVSGTSNLLPASAFVRNTSETSSAASGTGLEGVSGDIGGSAFQQNWAGLANPTVHGFGGNTTGGEYADSTSGFPSGAISGAAQAEGVTEVLDESAFFQNRVSIISEGDSTSERSAENPDLGASVFGFGEISGWTQRTTYKGTTIASGSGSADYLADGINAAQGSLSLEAEFESRGVVLQGGQVVSGSSSVTVQSNAGSE